MQPLGKCSSAILMPNSPILFCACDAGGARQLLYVAQEAREQGEAVCILSSKVTAPIFAELDFASEPRSITSTAEAEDYLRKLKPQAIVVGTTGTVGAERYLTAAGKERKIPTLAVLDEWYNYKLRFEDEEGEVGAYVPDAICVQDELSRRLAMEEGVPTDALYVTGNPGLAALAKMAKGFAKNPPALPKELEGANGRPIILFVAEKLKAAYGASEGEQGTFGSFLGYHEDIVREDLANALRTLGTDVFVLEKLHPADQGKEAPPHSANVEWKTFAGSAPAWPYLWHADVILGMRTKALLEAAVIGKHPISYQPNTKDPNGCTAVRLGLAPVVTSELDLESQIRDLFSKNGTDDIALNLPCTDPDSCKNILRIAKDLGKRA